jgi:aminobenzoyl-glutamate utilization protein B
VRRFSSPARRSAASASLLFVAAAFTPLSAQRPTSASLKDEVAAEAAGMAKLSQEIVDMVFSFSELGFQEKWTVEYLTGILRREGFTVETGCAGMPTCFVASYGSGDPVIGIMGDIDGLPETSQKPGVPWQEPLIPGGPGHGEGHNTAPAVDVVAAIAIKRVMERHRLAGEIRVIPGVAEELLASRTYMVNAGLFDDLDAMLSTHVSNEFRTQGYGLAGTGLVSTTYSFQGSTAHGTTPWAGTSALDAVELLNIGWNYRREHLRLEHRSHYVVTNGGNQPNVVPSEASAWYFFRETDYPRIRDLHDVGTTIARAAAMMTSTDMTERVLGATWPQIYNRPIAEAMQANVHRVGMPAWSEADQAFAHAVQRAMGREELGLRTEVAKEAEDLGESNGGASDDIGEVSWNVPTARLRYPAAIRGTTAHHWSAGIVMATPVAHKAANHGSRALAMTAIDLLTTPELLTAAWEDLRRAQQEHGPWESLVPPGTEPPVHLNQEKMDRVRPALEALRYDPTRFDTYLEQLGVEYPTLGR